MDNLIKKLRAQREFSVELAPGLKVLLRRPAEAEFAGFARLTGVEIASKFAVGWEGFTESFLLGPTVGAADAVAFAPDLWSEVVSDRIEWVAPIVEAVSKAVEAHLEAKGLIAKN